MELQEVKRERVTVEGGPGKWAPFLVVIRGPRDGVVGYARLTRAELLELARDALTVALSEPET